MKVQIAGVVKESVTDGPGLRTTIFFQGCAHHCKGCHNPHTWDFSGGSSVDVEDLIVDLALSPLIRGVTLTGGDPFFQPAAAVQIIHAVKPLGKDVWTYTGFTWDELLAEAQPDRLALMHASDVLVDGPFIEGLADFEHAFRGSANQRLIDMQKSFECGRVIEWITEH